MPEILIAILAGLLVGSFLNVCIYRLPRDLSVVAPRSFCPACEKTIAWYDLIPVVSYAVLGGHCRFCRAPISWRYPLVEIVTAALFAAAVLQQGATLSGVKLCLLCAILIALIFSDIEERILPDEFTLGGLVLGLALTYFSPRPPGVSRLVLPEAWSDGAVSLVDSAFAAAIASGALWFVAIVYEKLRHREGLGLGDVKMVAMMGAFLGVMSTLLALIIGSVAGSLIGLVYIAVARKEMSSYELPFGSFLGAGALLVAFFGRSLNQWYPGAGP